MTEIAITFLLLAIGGFLVLAIVLHFKEQARIERQRKAARLNSQLRLVRGFLDEMPTQYQPKDMRIWLYSRIIALSDQLLELQSDSNLARRRTQYSDELQSFQQSPDDRKPRTINDELMITSLKRMFESFRTYILLAQKEKSLSSDQARRFDDLLVFYKYKVSADFFAYKANQAFLNGKVETALSIYQEALSQLAPVKDSPDAQSSVIYLNQAIEEISQQSPLHVETSKTPANKEELDSEWEQFIDDNTFEEKKRF
ncbi:hypothetical protein [Marinomonas epiphytica]